jgi:hypothetical protein
MSVYEPPKTYTNNRFSSVFNIADFSSSDALGSLKNYANLFLSNVFIQTNYFTSINFSGSFK